MRWHRYCKRWQMAKATVGSGASMVVASYPGLGLAISAVAPAYRERMLTRRSLMTELEPMVRFEVQQIT